jgi:two-component system chemotaxis response regulator CheY
MRQSKEIPILSPEVVPDYIFLVIDDSPHLRALVSTYLRRAGYSRILTSASGLEGIEQYKLSRPDIVFLDVVMPEVDGMTTLKEIRKIDPEAVVVMTTSISSRDTVLQLKEAGAYSYLLKPFEEPKFRDILQRAVSCVTETKKQS